MSELTERLAKEATETVKRSGEAQFSIDLQELLGESGLTVDQLSRVVPLDTLKSIYLMGYISGSAAGWKLRKTSEDKLLSEKLGGSQ